MTNPNNSERPVAPGAFAEDLAGGRSGFSIVPQSDSPPRASIDLLRLSPFERDVFDAGVTHGYVMGHEAGVKWADDRAACLSREAARIVHLMAGVPEVDPEECRQRARAREARWSA